LPNLFIKNMHKMSAIFLLLLKII